MNWIFGIFSGDNDKKAELTNKEQEFERKMEASDWIEGTMNIDEAELTKEAAYEIGDTSEDTINKDYKLALSGMSDYNLAEMLAELKTANDLLATLDFNEEKEKALKSIKSNRKSVETKLLSLIGEHTLVDWKEAFKKFEEVDTVHPDEKDLYEQMPSGKWRKKTKFAPLSDKEKVEQMEGVGKEEEKGALAKDASLKTADHGEGDCPRCGTNPIPGKEMCETCTETIKTADEMPLPTDMPTSEVAPVVEESKPKLDDKITTKIDEKIEEKAEDIAVKIEEKIEEHADEMANKVEEKIEQKIDEAFNTGPMVTEDSPEDKVLDKLEVPHLEPGETPKSEMKEWKEDKKDDKKDDKKEDKKDDDKDEKEDKDEKDDKEASLKVKAFRAGDKGYYHGKPATIKDMYLNTFSGDATMEIECEGKVVHISGKELKNLNNEPLMEGMEHHDTEITKKIEDVAPPATPEALHPMEEISSKASKADVIKKFALLSRNAEIDSPWGIVKNNKGEEIVARVAPTLREKKSKEKTKKVDIRSKENI